MLFGCRTRRRGNVRCRRRKANPRRRISSSRGVITVLRELGPTCYHGSQPHFAWVTPRFCFLYVLKISCMEYYTSFLTTVVYDLYNDTKQSVLLHLSGLKTSCMSMQTAGCTDSKGVFCTKWIAKLDCVFAFRLYRSILLMIISNAH